MKLGWIAACGPEGALKEALNGLEWIADLFLSVGTPVQIALPKLLEGRTAYQAALRERIGANLSILTRSREPFTLLEGEGGLSAVLRFEARGGAAKTEGVAEWALRSREVLLHPGHFYDLPREDDAVVSLLTPPAVMTEAVARIRDGWGESQTVD